MKQPWTLGERTTASSLPVASSVMSEVLYDAIHLSRWRIFLAMSRMSCRPDRGAGAAASWLSEVRSDGALRAYCAIHPVIVPVVHPLGATAPALWHLTPIPNGASLEAIATGQAPVRVDGARYSVRSH